MPTASAYLKSLNEQSQNLRQKAQDDLNKKQTESGGRAANDAAALERRHALPRRRYLTRHLDRRIERPGDVDLEIGFEKDVVAPMLVHQRRAVRAELTLGAMMPRAPVGLGAVRVAAMVLVVVFQR